MHFLVGCHSPMSERFLDGGQAQPHARERDRLHSMFFRGGFLTDLQKDQSPPSVNTVTDGNEYITYAECCLAIARTASNRETRIMLREKAAEWTRLANTLDGQQYSPDKLRTSTSAPRL
jgi:hypothetical protein